MEAAVKAFKKGEVIFEEGANELFMYAMVHGTVGIYANYGKENEKLLTEVTAEKGGFFGEMGLIDSAPRSASAVALDDVQVREISAETFGEFFSDHPDAILRIMKHLSQRVRSLTVDYLDACRAVTEAVEAEKTGKSKSGWFKEKVKKFIQDYEDAYREYGSLGSDVSASYHMYSSSHFWMM